MPLLLNDPVRAQVLLLPGTTGNDWVMWLSTTDLKSGHHHGGEGPLMGGAARLGLAPRPSQPITGGFLAFLAQERGWMLWGNPGAGVKIRGKGLQGRYPPAISNVPVTATGIAGRSFLTIPSSSPSAGRRLRPSPGRRCSQWRPRSWGTGVGRHLLCLGRPASCRRVKLPKERREEDRKNNHKNLFHAAWIPPRMQQCFWTANL